MTYPCRRSHHQAPVRGGGDDLYSLPPAIKLLTIQRWSILWRSIIASALDATLFPYCRYIKSLDFRDLGNLLDEDQFRNKGVKYVLHILEQSRNLTMRPDNSLPVLSSSLRRRRHSPQSGARSLHGLRMLTSLMPLERVEMTRYYRSMSFRLTHHSCYAAYSYARDHQWRT